MTYASLNEQANRIAMALIRMDVKPGDHVGLSTPNSGDWHSFYFGVLKAGAVPVTLSRLLKKDELQLLVGHPRPRVLFAFEGKLDDLKPLRGLGGVETVISPGGENVYPKEVEDVLFIREEVQECAVIGLPDREWGERIAAFIIQRPGKNFNKEELHAFLKSRLSSFKVPKEYRLVEDFPKSPAGKILKKELKKLTQESGR
jgi:acyl-CoA synthetase (AMP-forming)/AMP-acid ligase II